jgi:hypothetical protein
MSEILRAVGERQALSPLTAVDFLQKLRPGGPWLLTAIIPDGATETITAHNADEVAGFVQANNGERNLYYAVNPLRRAMQKKAAKADVAAIEFMLADLDPNKDEPPPAAKQRYLDQLNACEPKPTFVVDSGNGIQCLWRLDQPIPLSPKDQATIADVEARTKAVMEALGSPAGTQNIDRILRLPGTINLPNKKKREEGRCECATALLSSTGAVAPLDAFPLPNIRGTRKEGAKTELPQELRLMLHAQGDRPAGYPSRSELFWAFINAALRKSLDENAFVDACLDSAYDGCSIYEHVCDNGGEDYVKKQIARVPEGKKPQTIQLDTLLNSAAELQHLEFEPLRWIVPDIIPEGTTVLGGRPKIGKSWAALDVAVALASGGECFGKQCEQGDVLALFLEDSNRRLQRRMTKMLGVHKTQWPSRLTYATQWPRGNEAIAFMRQWIAKVATPRLIIVDVLQRIRPRTNAKSQETQYASDYEMMAALQALSTEVTGLAILVLHHQRKMDADDLFDTLSGTLGLGGGMDTGLILGTENGQKFLYGRGRDIEEFTINIKQNEVMRWQVLGPKRADNVASPERAQILTVLEQANSPMTVNEIAQAVGGTTAQQKKNVSHLLGKLLKEGVVTQTKWGKYEATPW